MKSILVTGGCGMIGSNLVKRLVLEGWEVSVVDNLWRGRIENLHDNSGRPVIDLEKRFFQLDLREAAQAEAVIGRAAYIVHLADIVAGIDYVFHNQGEIFRANNQINSNVFAACRKAGSERIKGLIYVGTACSFPQSRQSSLTPTPLREEELFPAWPESAYGWSKLMGQLEIDYLEKETGIPCCTLMLHNVYGTPTDFEDRSQVIPALIRKAIMYPKAPFSVWGSGQQSRAFLHLDDVISAILTALHRGWGHGAIQIGPATSTSIRELADMIVAISGKTMPVVFDTERPEGDKARCADYSKAKAQLGWEPRVPLEAGLARTYSWIETRMRGAL